MLILGLVVAALAHARLVESVPADGAVLAAVPTRVTLRFDGLVEGAISRVVLEGEPPIVLAPIAEEADPRTILTALPPLGPGTWRLTWRVVSRDGHPVTGTLRFTVR